MAAGTGNFIREIVEADLAAARNDGRILTRFPPEPNGFLHVGHAKSICLNFGIAADYGGACNLRFDDTNPTKEEAAYVRSIIEDVRWLGYEWDGEVKFASDYFERMYEFAVDLIEKGDAYVDDQSAEEIRINRGTLTEPGIDSPYRGRPVAENLALFRAMRNGEFANGAKVLRARIDMKSPNLNLRDPVMYRILHAHHHRTGDDWCIYPMYDWAHGLEDSIEAVTHSLCTLEFEDHRPLYDWFLRRLGVFHPQQIEFARLNLSYTVLSKRKLNQLVGEGHVAAWDDPRMPTISGLRRRGYTPAAIRNFCDRVGVTKKDALIEVGLLENALREDLDRHAQRRMAVINPLRVVIENYPDGSGEVLRAPNHPANPQMGERELPFSKEIYIDSGDFMEDPPKKYFRLAPGREVRLRYAYFITCKDLVKDQHGRVTELRCTYDPQTRGGAAPDGRKVKGTIHWVSAAHAREAEIRLYDRLFRTPEPSAGGRDFREDLNHESLEVISRAYVEPDLASASAEQRFQFEREGYFCADRHDSRATAPVFNRTVTLRDSWAKLEQGGHAD